MLETPGILPRFRSGLAGARDRIETPNNAPVGGAKRHNFPTDAQLAARLADEYHVIRYEGNGSQVFANRCFHQRAVPQQRPLGGAEPEQMPIRRPAKQSTISSRGA